MPLTMVVHREKRVLLEGIELLAWVEGVGVKVPDLTNQSTVLLIKRV